MPPRIALALALLLAPCANAQNLFGPIEPSFDCERARTPTEHAICDDRGLARLDVTMADAYDAQLARRTGDAAQRLDDEQALWRRWRDTCGGDAACLLRRYQQRVIDLVPGTAFGAAGGADLENGKYAVTEPDGTIRLYDTSGAWTGTIYPDGTRDSVAFVHVPGIDDDVPPPSDGGAWMTELEQRLVGIALGFLSPEDHDAYRRLHDGFDRPTRIDRHVTAIGAMSGG